MLTRREFLKTGAILGSAAILAPNELLAYKYRMPVDRTLKFYNIHTGEHLKATYWAKDHFVKSELDAIKYFLRDFRTGEMKDVDINLLDILYSMQLIKDSNKAFRVISGYRSKKTNNMLRKTNEGVAKNSYHVKAQAIDINLPGTHLKDLTKLARFLKRGGVGYYPRSGFMHIDTGPIRYWKFG